MSFDLTERGCDLKHEFSVSGPIIFNTAFIVPRGKKKGNWIDEQKI
jgi:hypothetical protein